MGAIAASGGSYRARRQSGIPRDPVDNLTPEDWRVLREETHPGDELAEYLSLIPVQWEDGSRSLEPATDRDVVELVGSKVLGIIRNAPRVQNQVFGRKAKDVPKYN